MGACGQARLPPAQRPATHWRNENYAGFEDFLGALASRKRKAIRGERKRATEGGIEIEWVTGADLTEAYWDAFFHGHWVAQIGHALCDAERLSA